MLVLGDLLCNRIPSPLLSLGIISLDAELVNSTVIIPLARGILRRRIADVVDNAHPPLRLAQLREENLAGPGLGNGTHGGDAKDGVGRQVGQVPLEVLLRRPGKGRELGGDHEHEWRCGPAYEQ
jgi:hypothetical protein